MVTRAAQNMSPRESWVAAARRRMLVAYLVAFGALAVLRGIDMAIRG